MNITKIELLNFRCYKSFKIDKLTNLNLIIGSNGIGKTSIIEAIYIGSLAKTFKSNDDISIIRNGESFSNIKIKLFDSYIFKNLDFYIDNNGKKTKINDKLQSKLSDYISQYSVILLSPDELKIIKLSPIVRRNYLNIQISQLNKGYLKVLNDYNKLIKNKNQFLKKVSLNSNLDLGYIDVVNEKIVDLGLLIYQYRKNYINLINDNISKYFKFFNKNDTIFIKYESDFEVNNRNKLINLLKKNRNKEITLGMCNIGIHRDDYYFMHNNVNAKEFSSQGTQKLIILSMKLAEIEIFKNKYNKDPIILLDDLFSELDVKNRNKIFKSFNNDSQIFITTTDIKNIDKNILKKAKIFDIDEKGWK